MEATVVDGFKQRLISVFNLGSSACGQWCGVVVGELCMKTGVIDIGPPPAPAAAKSVGATLLETSWRQKG